MNIVQVLIYSIPVLIICCFGCLAYARDAHIERADYTTALDTIDDLAASLTDCENDLSAARAITSGGSFELHVHSAMRLANVHARAGAK